MRCMMSTDEDITHIKTSIRIMLKQIEALHNTIKELKAEIKQPITHTPYGIRYKDIT